MLTGVLLWTLLPDGDGGASKDTASGGTTGGDSDGADAEEPGDGEKIVIGVKADRPGLSFKEPDGRYTGFDADTARYLANSLGYGPKNIKWREVNNAESVSVLQKREVHFLVSGFAMTDQRATEVDFVGPYLEARQDVLLRKNDTSVKKPDDLNGKAVCTTPGSTAEVRLKADVAPQADVRTRSTYAECVEALKRSEVDAVTTDDTILAGHAVKQPGVFKLGGFAMSQDRFGVGLPKDSPLEKDLTAALKKMIADGTWAKIRARNLPAVPDDPPTVS